MKRFQQEEFECVRVLRQDHSDTAAAVECRCGGGLFRATPSFPAEERAKLWREREGVPGQIATVKFQERSPQGIPRFPVLVGLRHADDV